MKKTISLLVFLLGLQMINGQAAHEAAPKDVRVTGTVLDQETGDPLPYATLVLTSVADPSQVTGGITDDNGKFDVKVPSGRYNISVEFISYKPFKEADRALTKNTDLGTIRLSMDVAQLEEVEVVGERTTVEMRLDKKVYNIGKDITTSGGNVSDALANVPSVDVDVDGAISLRGNENVRILINGKPSAMAGFGSTDALGQLPADAIEKVEIITSPSARYDAEGTAGIINVVLKKEKTLGFNGSAQISAGYPNNSQITANGNLRKEKFNLFSTLGYSYRTPPGNGFADNTYNSGEFSRITEDRDIEREGGGFNGSLGMEYFLTESSSITGNFFTRFGNGDDITTLTSNRYKSGVLDSETKRIENEGEEDNTYQFSLNYTNKFNDDGHELTADFQYSLDHETEDSDIVERKTFPNTDLVNQEQVYQYEKQKEYLIQADYVLPMGDSQFEAGFRGNYEQTITDYQLDSLDQTSGMMVPNLALTNVFTYDENITALYTQYGNKFGDFSFLLGLRLENTQLKGHVDADQDVIDDNPGVDLNFDKNYLGLFPTVNLVYEFGEEENVSLGYNRRINRPRGYFINPFPSRSSRANIWQGNPDLDPAYSNAFDLGYLKRWEQLTLTASVYYQKETNSFERIQEETGLTTPDGIEIIRSIPINLSTNQRYGGEMGLMYNPAKWLRLNGSMNIFLFDKDGEYNGIDYGSSNTSWFARAGSKVSLPAKIDWQTTLFYMGPRENSQTRSDGVFSVNMALSKDILKDNGTITLNVSDLFNSRKWQSYTETQFFTSDSESQWRERQITFSFMYRFNQQKNDRNNRNRNNNNDMDEGGEGFEG